jgi:hypothetical protein
MLRKWSAEDWRRERLASLVLQMGQVIRVFGNLSSWGQHKGIAGARQVQCWYISRVQWYQWKSLHS